MADEFPRVLRDLRHGEHVVTEEIARVQRDAGAPQPASVSRTAGAVFQNEPIKEISTPFGYMFGKLADAFPGAHLDANPAEQTVEALKALGSAMIEQDPEGAAGDSDLPPILTYWGQFVDHDLTANTDRDGSISIIGEDLRPLEPLHVTEKLRNLREPRLNLDSLYGNGPDASELPGQVPYKGHAFVLTEQQELTKSEKPIVPGLDLPRSTKQDEKGKALIGDGRNDENLVVAQLHVAFLKFHNNVLGWLARQQDEDLTFERARQLTTWHYQFVTVEDFLKRIVADPAQVDLLKIERNALFRPDKDAPFMPLEFSVAAFRFGHSMVRGAYDWNQNFGAPAVPGGTTTIDSAPFNLLFSFTGNGGLRAGPTAAVNPTLPDNWPAQFRRLTGADPQPEALPDRAFQSRFARKIDTHLAPPLSTLSNEGKGAASAEIRRLLKRLAARNLLRGYRLAIPTGQAVATELGIAPLTVTQLTSPPGPVSNVLQDNPELLGATPLWFYVLKEAEVLGRGDRLGPVGSRIVAETIMGQLRADQTSYLNNGFVSADGVLKGVIKADGGQVRTIIDFLEFAGMHN